MCDDLQRARGACVSACVCACIRASGTINEHVRQSIRTNTDPPLRQRISLPRTQQRCTCEHEPTTRGAGDIIIITETNLRESHGTVVDTADTCGLRGGARTISRDVYAVKRALLHGSRKQSAQPRDWVMDAVAVRTVPVCWRVRACVGRFVGDVSTWVGSETTMRCQARSSNKACDTATMQ